MSRPKPTPPRTRKGYASKPAPMAFSAQYWAWRAAVAANRGIPAAAQAHHEFIIRNRVRRAAA